MGSGERYLTKIRGRRCLGFRCSIITIMATLAMSIFTGSDAWSYPNLAIHCWKTCTCTEKSTAVHSRRDFVNIVSSLSFAGPLLMDSKRSNAAESKAEAMEEFNAYYFQAEGAAYQSLFVEHSSAKSTPESLLKTAKDDIIQMEKYMDQLAIQLDL